MVRVGEDQGILTLDQPLRFSLRSITRTMLVITTEPSHRFTGAYYSLLLRLSWLGHRSPPEHVQNRL